MKNTYEILGEEIIFTTENEMIEVNLESVICELIAMTGNEIKEENGILLEQVDLNGYLTAEEMDYISNNWIDVEMDNIEQAVYSVQASELPLKKLKKEGALLIESLKNL